MKGKQLYAPVKRQDKLSVQVANHIQDLILSGRLKVGDQLPPERDLCAQFGVSRTVIREAVRTLEAKGLLVSQSGSGTYVRGIQSEDVVDSIGMYIITQDKPISHAKLMEVRRVLEVQIAGLAAERATPESLEELDRLITKMDGARDDARAFAQFDLEFHVALARATGNELLQILLDPFMDALYEARRLASELPGVPEEAMAFHRDIREKVGAGDAQGAARAMSAHLDQSNRVILRALKHEPA
jgi:DNA-binding FadR family transcriptional regulator